MTFLMIILIGLCKVGFYASNRILLGCWDGCCYPLTFCRMDIAVFSEEFIPSITPSVLWALLQKCRFFFCISKALQMSNSCKANLESSHYGVENMSSEISSEHPPNGFHNKQFGILLHFDEYSGPVAHGVVCNGFNIR